MLVKRIWLTAKAMAMIIKTTEDAKFVVGRIFKIPRKAGIQENQFQAYFNHKILFQIKHLTNL
ncbi:MAG: hypothetical protein CVT94_07580 [Bacteroidetes bacterium HGW-Bacteroidetes-11]|nr:MAG: hypothetical protein CVT94_07580 [Bacteroidetes bacterium HGW-Bacteroidetes-11]